MAALADVGGETPASGSGSEDGPDFVPLESPPVTGIPFEAGVVAFGAPSTNQAGPLLIFNVGAQVAGGEVETFGRILSGLRMLQSQQRAASTPTIPELSEPVVIERAVRREPPIRD